MIFITFPINRKISQRITPWLALLRLTPNQVTLLSLGFGSCGAWNFLRGDPQGWLLGALCLEAAYLLDNCDGELARMTGSSSGFGSWLDTVSDCLIHMAFFLSLGIGLYRYQPNPLWVKLGQIAAGGVLFTYVTYVLEQVQLRGRSALFHPDPPLEESPQGLWEKLRKIFREDFSWVVLGSALSHQMGWLLWSGIFGSLTIGFASVSSMLLRERRLKARGSGGGAP